MRIENDSAVSPVIGVMLMLVVTIVIAAVVSGFAGGLAGGAGKTPQASIEGTADLVQHQLIFEHKGGDAFTLRDVKVILASEDAKTTLTTADVGTNAVAFEELGAADNMIATGDKFVLEGVAPGWTEGITFGSMTLVKNTKTRWTIVDKATDRMIASGSIALV
jgi:FlaG/FlaF family flagellin (archaellin)